MSDQCEYHGVQSAIMSHSIGEKKKCRCCNRLVEKRWIDLRGFCADCHFNCDLRNLRGEEE